jgi:hypothetical protein
MNSFLNYNQDTNIINKNYGGASPNKYINSIEEEQLNSIENSIENTTQITDREDETADILNSIQSIHNNIIADDEKIAIDVLSNMENIYQEENKNSYYGGFISHNILLILFYIIILLGIIILFNYIIMNKNCII